MEEPNKIEKLEKSLDKFEQNALCIFAIVLFSPVIMYCWISDRHYYRNKLSKIKVGDRFAIQTDTEFINSDSLYEAIAIDGHFIEFKNEKGWYDKIHRDKVKKLIFI